ncbi:MAG: DUF4831 family protein [Muribaculaceae bacterium]|nr:DUF4831 family protein [Muribaculaceae bacterium]
MKIQKILPSLLLLAALMIPGRGEAQQTRLLTADRHNEYGLAYTLPNTALDIEVTAERTIRKAGKYFQYAKKYIGTDDVVKADSESWTITSVKVSSYGVPDDENRYLMQLKPGAVTYICVDNSGMLLAINKEITFPENNMLTRSGIVPDTGSFSNAQQGREAKVGMQDYLKYVDEDFLASQSSAKQAQMLAENLLEIRDSRISLTRGTAETMPTDGRQLELMLSNLAHQEASIMAAFCGTTETQTVTRHYSFMPEEEGRKVLFRMSDFAGFVGPDDLSGDPVYISVIPGREPELPVDAKGEVKKLPKDAVMYAIPGSAKINLTLSGRTLFEKEMEFGQFGITFGLSPALFSDKKAPSYAVFDPATGAIREIGDYDRE